MSQLNAPSITLFCKFSGTWLALAFNLHHATESLN